MKASFKRSLKFQLSKYGLFLSTIVSTIYVQQSFPILSLKTACITFLGFSAYLFGTVIIQQIEQGKIKL